MAAVKGVDVSQFQGSVTWPAVAAAGFGFAIVKVSEGGDFIDPVDGTKADPDTVRLGKLTDRCAEVHAQKMVLGVYHLLRPRLGRTGAVEADFAVKTARQVGWGRVGDLRLCVDVELTDLGPKPTHAYLAEFVARYQQLTGHLPIIYTTPSFWTLLGNPPVLGCPLWIAHHNVLAPSVPAPWPEFAIWQQSDTAAVAGIDGDACLDQAATLPLIPAVAPPPMPSHPPTPAPPTPGPPTHHGSSTAALLGQLTLATKAFAATGTNHALLILLTIKARLGLWDDRYCLFFGPPTDVQTPVKAFIMRGYVLGLVPTSTTKGGHAPGSFHFQGRAADMGLRTSQIGTANGLKLMQTFQTAEFNRRAKTHAIEIIGPLNNLVVLQGAATHLVEGTELEQAHDNHVHGAF